MRQNSNTSWLVRHSLPVLLLCLVAEVYPQQNYIRTFVPKVQVSPSDGATASNSTATTVYYDAAGRELQTTHTPMISTVTRPVTLHAGCSMHDITCSTCLIVLHSQAETPCCSITLPMVVGYVPRPLCGNQPLFHH